MDVRGRIRKVHYDFYLCFTLPYMFDPWLVVAGKLLFIGQKFLTECFQPAVDAGALKPFCARLCRAVRWRGRLHGLTTEFGLGRWWPRILIFLMRPFLMILLKK